VMALRARELPPTLHYQAPNPALELSASPFFVSDEPRPWEPRSGVRRAGVSSFGVGGTNAHVVLQEAPDVPAPMPGGEWQALVLSARTPEALDQAAERLAAHLRAHPEQALVDMAWTLAAGRREMEHRRVVVCRTHAEGAALLDAPTAAASPADGALPVAFLFPGQGAQYAGMGRGLYDAEPVYREEVDRCAALLQPHLGLDLRTLLHPAPGDEAPAGARLAETWLTQPALFVVGYAARPGCGPRAASGRRRSWATAWASTWRPAWPASFRWRMRWRWWPGAGGWCRTCRAAPCFPCRCRKTRCVPCCRPVFPWRR
jgi:phthiocerol/phenolphthiocerol synthesis type-I polyketide synthase E